MLKSWPPLVSGYRITSGDQSLKTMVSTSKQNIWPVELLSQEDNKTLWLLAGKVTESEAKRENRLSGKNKT